MKRTLVDNPKIQNEKLWKVLSFVLYFLHSGGNSTKKEKSTKRNMIL